jgi:hypothetical protein
MDIQPTLMVNLPQLAQIAAKEFTDIVVAMAIVRDFATGHFSHWRHSERLEGAKNLDLACGREILRRAGRCAPARSSE